MASNSDGEMRETITVVIIEDAKTHIFTLEMISVPREGDCIWVNSDLFEVYDVRWIIKTGEDNPLREVHLYVVRGDE